MFRELNMQLICEPHPARRSLAANNNLPAGANKAQGYQLMPRATREHRAIQTLRARLSQRSLRRYRPSKTLHAGSKHGSSFSRWQELLLCPAAPTYADQSLQRLNLLSRAP